MIRISSKRHNFRRCGMAHPKEPTEYPNDRFSEAELEILRAEPMLIVEEVDADPEKMTVAQLREELEGTEIPAAAKKADLVELVKKTRTADEQAATEDE